MAIDTLTQRPSCKTSQPDSDDLSTLSFLPPSDQRHTARHSSPIGSLQKVQDFITTQILNVACQEIDLNGGMTGLGIPVGQINRLLRLQGIVHNTCVKIGESISDQLIEKLDSKSQDTLSILQLLGKQPELQRKVKFLTNVIESLTEEKKSQLTTLLVDCSPDDDQIRDIIRLQQATFMHPFDGRVDDLGLSTIALQTTDIHKMIACGARFNMALDSEGHVLAYSIFFRPENVSRDNPYTRHIANWYPDSKDTGMLLLILVGNRHEDHNSGANNTTQSMYQKLIFSTWLSLKNSGTNTVAALVHENNFRAAMTHATLGGAKINFDQTVPVSANHPDLDTLSASDTPSTVFLGFNMDISGNRKDAVSYRYSLLQEFKNMWTSSEQNIHKYTLRLGQRIEVLRAKLKIHELIETPETITPGNENFALLKQLVQKVLAASSPHVQTLTQVPAKNLTSESLGLKSLQEELGLPRYILRKLENTEKALRIVSSFNRSLTS